MGMLADVVGCADPGVKNGLCTDWRRRRRNPGIDASAIGMNISKSLAAFFICGGAVLMISYHFHS